jgi:hypothetical protein
MSQLKISGGCFGLIVPRRGTGATLETVKTVLNSVSFG